MRIFKWRLLALPFLLLALTVGLLRPGAASALPAAPRSDAVVPAKLRRLARRARAPQANLWHTDSVGARACSTATARGSSNTPERRPVRSPTSSCCRNSTVRSSSSDVAIPKRSPRPGMSRLRRGPDARRPRRLPERARPVALVVAVGTERAGGPSRARCSHVGSTDAARRAHTSAYPRLGLGVFRRLRAAGERRLVRTPRARTRSSATHDLVAGAVVGHNRSVLRGRPRSARRDGERDQASWGGNSKPRRAFSSTSVRAG